MSLNSLSQSNKETLQQKCFHLLNKVVIKSKTDSSVYPNLKKGASPITESRAYPILIELGVDIENDIDRKIALLVLSTFAKWKYESMPASSAVLYFARAFRSVRPDKVNEQNGSDLILTKLIDSQSTMSLLENLKRPLSMIESKQIDINFAKLWADLITFKNHPDVIKRNWASDFYRYQKEQQEAV